MKIGKTREEIYADYAELKKKQVKVFAWLPRYCYDTNRYVWLEYVYKRYEGYYKWECKAYYYENPA